jgi:hypothetical protein
LRPASTTKAGGIAIRSDLANGSRGPEHSAISFRGDGLLKGSVPTQAHITQKLTSIDEKAALNVTRDDLYELVWSKPMRELAQDVSVTAVTRY